MRYLDPFMQSPRAPRARAFYFVICIQADMEQKILLFFVFIIKQMLEKQHVYFYAEAKLCTVNSGVSILASLSS